jgi:hypothetical protein
MTMRPLTVFHTLFILEKKYNVEWLLHCVHVIWKSFQWHMSVVSLPSTCLIIAVVTYAKKEHSNIIVSCISNWEIGGDCWYCCDYFGECDVNDGSLIVSWNVPDKCFKEGSWL